MAPPQARVVQEEAPFRGKASQQHEEKRSIIYRALQQATGEVLLAQSSDWPFNLTMGTQTGYATKGPVSHLSRAHRLLAIIDEGDLGQLEERDPVVRDVDHSLFG